MVSLIRGYRYSLRSLLVAPVFAAIALVSWRFSGLYGVAVFAAILGLASLNLVLAGIGAKLGCPVLSGILSGALLWSIACVFLGTMDAGLFPLETSLWFGGMGALAGLACGYVTALTRGSNPVTYREGRLYCGGLFVVFIAVFGIGRFVAWQKVLHKDFNLASSYYSPDASVRILEFWGKGVDDTLFTLQLADVSTDEKLEVRFRYTRVTDAGVRRLADFTNLTKADLRGSLVTASGEASLRNKLPQCEIIR